MNEAERFAAIRAKVAEVIAKATTMYHVDLSNLSTSMKIRGTTGGRAGVKHINGKRLYILQLNRDMILNGGFDHMLNDTVPHEIAHLVCAANPFLGSRHDTGWKRVCVALGGNGLRCHNEEVEYAHGGFDYLSSSGKKITVSKIRHQKIQKGTSYTFRNGGGRLDRTCAWVASGGVMPAAPVVAPLPPPVPKVSRYPWGEVVFAIRPPVQQTTRSVANGSMSKAEQVRSWIRAAKQLGQGQDSVIQKAILQLSMSRAQASRYVVENWVKV